MKDPFKNKPLSFGQVLYAISGSEHPSPVLVDRLRYLRRLGIPFAPNESQGSGHRMSYTFDHLFECGLAIAAQDMLKPQEVQQIIVNHRADLRKVGRTTLANLGEGWASILHRYDPGGAHDDRWRIVLTDRHDPDPCNFYLMGMGDRKPGALVTKAIHQLPQSAPITGRHIALKPLVASLVFRAMQAPETKPGRQ